MYVFPIKYKFFFPNIKLLDQNSLSITMEDGDTYYGETKLNNKIVFLTGKLGNFIDHLLQMLLPFYKEVRITVVLPSEGKITNLFFH